MTVELAYTYFYIAVLIVLALLVFAVFIRVIKGPLMADRIIGINSVGTLVIMIICILSRYLKEDYLLDVAVLYALISFLAVVVLTKIYSGVYLNRIEDAKKKEKPAVSEQNGVSNDAITENKEADNLKFAESEVRHD